MFQTEKHRSAARQSAAGLDLSCPICGATGEPPGLKQRVSWGGPYERLANHLICPRNYALSNGWGRSHGLATDGGGTWATGCGDGWTLHRCVCGWEMRAGRDHRVGDGPYGEILWRMGDGTWGNVWQLFVEHVQTDPQLHACLEHLVVNNGY